MLFSLLFLRFFTCSTASDMIPMWKVQNKDYSNTKGYKAGLVTRQWGYLDSPDTEIIDRKSVV